MTRLAGIVGEATVRLLVKHWDKIRARFPGFKSLMRQYPILTFSNPRKTHHVWSLCVVGAKDSDGKFPGAVNELAVAVDMMTFAQIEPS